MRRHIQINPCSGLCTRPSLPITDMQEQLADEMRNPMVIGESHFLLLLKKRSRPFFDGLRNTTRRKLPVADKIDQQQLRRVPLLVQEMQRCQPICQLVVSVHSDIHIREIYT